ncbi:hypothetical protein [Parafrankia soli]|uniref:hypothetical protein n=1 Tax=Parafrankia soli TaxID=2599596 RepID=UPI0008DA2BA8|nr:hypothetical protein [Parafrankia soli]
MVVLRVAVGEICRRLDGIPLAIELAAVKTRALPPAEILARLSENTEILRHDGRRVADRQRTLRTCVDWSFDLCTPQERLLWTHLSVFAGGFELDAGTVTGTPISPRGPTRSGPGPGSSRGSAAYVSITPTCRY